MASQAPATATVKLLLSGSVGQHSGVTTQQVFDTSIKVSAAEALIVAKWATLFPTCPNAYTNCNMHLLKNGSILAKDKTLAEFNFNNESVVHVVVLKKLTKETDKEPKKSKTAKEEDAEASSKRCCVVQ